MNGELWSVLLASKFTSFERKSGRFDPSKTSFDFKPFHQFTGSATVK